MNLKKLGVIFALTLVVLMGLFAMPGGEGIANVNPIQNVHGAYVNGTWTGTYADVMNATQDIFDLYGDIGTLLGQNIGNTLSATIQLFIYAILVIMPFAVVFGVVVTAIMLVKGKARRIK